MFQLNYKGYTLIELVISIGILSIGIVTVFGLFNFVLRNERSVRSTFVATYLASEGIELVRNIRDANWKNGRILQDGSSQDWRQGLTIPLFCTTEGSGCGMDYSQWNLSLGLGNNPLRFDSSSGRYSYASGTETLFRRILVVEDKDTPYSLRVRSIVRWSQGGANRSITIEDYLYNWREP